MIKSWSRHIKASSRFHLGSIGLLVADNQRNTIPRHSTSVGTPPHRKATQMRNFSAFHGVCSHISIFQILHTYYDIITLESLSLYFQLFFPFTHLYSFNFGLLCILSMRFLFIFQLFEDLLLLFYFQTPVSLGRLCLYIVKYHRQDNISTRHCEQTYVSNKETFRKPNGFNRTAIASEHCGQQHID